MPEDRQCKCGTPQYLSQKKSVPVEFRPDLNEYHLVYSSERGSGDTLLRYCPSCGGRFEGSTRHEQFFTIPDEEVTRLSEPAGNSLTLGDPRTPGRIR